jgi:hypothetical protein
VLGPAPQLVEQRPDPQVLETDGERRLLPRQDRQFVGGPAPEPGDPLEPPADPEEPRHHPGGAPAPAEGADHDVGRDAEVAARVVDYAEAVEKEVRPQEAEVPEADVVTFAEGPAPAQSGVEAVAGEGDVRCVDQQQPAWLQHRVAEAQEVVGVEDVLDGRQRDHELEGVRSGRRRPIDLGGRAIEVDAQGVEPQGVLVLEVGRGVVGAGDAHREALP